jgi:hypothetical protein
LSVPENFLPFLLSLLSEQFLACLTTSESY